MAEQEHLGPVALPYKIKLEEAIDTGEDGKPPIQEISIVRKPKGGDWGAFKIEGATIDDFLRIGGRICNVPYTVLKKIDTKAAFQLTEAIGRFLS